jgi:hypothetical protein
MTVDGVNITPGAGAAIATDQVGSFHYQLVKPVFGPDDSAPTSVTSASPLPVDPSLWDGSAWNRVRPASFVDDSGGAQMSGMPVSADMQFNGAIWERVRGNVNTTLLASQSRGASTSSPIQTNHSGRGVIVFFELTTVPSGGSVRPYLYAPASPYSVTASGLNWQLAPTPAPLTVPGPYAIEICPGSSAGATGSVTQRTAGLLPRSWFLYISHADSQLYTYSATYSVIV